MRAGEPKIENLQFSKGLPGIFKVGHPGASSISIKILSGGQLLSDFKLSRNLIDSGMENDIKIDPKNLPWMTCSTLGSSLGTPWEHPGIQGPEIDDS